MDSFIKQDFKSVIEFLSYFDSEEKCINYLAEMRWHGNPTCPHCQHDHLYSLKGKNKRYKCASCRKQFSVRVGTIFEDSKIELRKWFLAIYFVINHKKGISSLQLSRDINVTQKTAWFMLQRIRYALFDEDMNKEKLDGVVEVDETYVGGKNKNRHWNKKFKYSQGRSTKDKTPVFGMLKRKGKVLATVVPDVGPITLRSIIRMNVPRGFSVISDEWRSYKGLKYNYNHSVINHSRKEYVSGVIHTNTIEGFWSLLKRSIIGIYHSTSRKYLNYYLNEFTYRYNTRHLTDSHRFQLTFFSINKRLKFDDLVKVR